MGSPIRISRSHPREVRVSLAPEGAPATTPEGECAKGICVAHESTVDFLNADLPDRIDFVNRGFDYEAAELAVARWRLTEMARAGGQRANARLNDVKTRERRQAALRARRFAELRAETAHVRTGEVVFLVYSLVVPARDIEDAEGYEAEAEAIAIDVATAYEQARGVDAKDVSKSELARRAGLPDWPEFDLLSANTNGVCRKIEVKGRAETGNVEMSGNEWAKACKLRDEDWLYVVFNCASPRPRLVRRAGSVCQTAGRETGDCSRFH